MGGDSNGDCAFVRLNREDDDEKRFHQVDARLPISLPIQPEQSEKDDNTDAGSVSVVDSSASAVQNHFQRQPELLTQEFGGDIVNSITMHEVANNGLSEWNEPVALLSNNDKTVKVYSLLQRKVVAEMLHPFPMNYALMSPDSNILAAVGDGCRAFFYRRKLIKPPSGEQQSTTSKRFPRYEWQLFAIPKLPVGERMNDDHSFAITFSPSGHLCAISSQGGMITVFDMETLTNLSEEEESDKAFFVHIQVLPSRDMGLRQIHGVFP